METIGKGKPAHDLLRRILCPQVFQALVAVPFGKAAAILGQQAVISVEDTGCGIREADLPRIKQKFFKAKNSVRGSGIGLAVVDEIVGTLGGKFDIASTLGQGTTVTVTLPVYHPGQEHLHDKI